MARGRLVEALLPAGARLTPAMPVTLNRGALPHITDDTYMAMEKTDGVRYMLYIGSLGSFFIGRNRSCHDLEGVPALADSHNLLDGELVDGNKFVVFDAMIVNSECVTHLDFPLRMRAARRVAFNLRDHVAPAVALIVKTAHSLQNIAAVMGTNCKHVADGVILVPLVGPYVFGVDARMYKWKCPAENTVDWFVSESGVMHFADRMTDGPPVPFSTGRLRPDHRFALPGVLECFYDREIGMWVATRARTDKTVPNFATTIFDALQAIADNITPDELLQTFTCGAVV